MKCVTCGCRQFMWPVGMVSGCGQWVVDLLDYLIIKYTYSCLCTFPTLYLIRVYMFVNHNYILNSNYSRELNLNVSKLPQYVQTI